MKKHRLVYFFLCIFLYSVVVSCRSQSTNEQISVTTVNVLQAVKDSNSTIFISLIGSDLKSMGKDEELIQFDVKKIHDYLLTTYGSKPATFEITETYNFLGQKRVKVILDKSTPNSIITLNLLFGPNFISPLNKITGYEFVINSSDSLDFKPYEYWKKNGIAH